MSEIKTEEKPMTRQQALLNIATTIKFLQNIVDKSIKHPIDDHLQKEIRQLEELKKRILENGESYTPQ